MASEVATTDIGTLFLATVLIHWSWKNKINWQEGYWTFLFLIVLLTLLVHCQILMVLNESPQLLEFLILHLCLKCFWKRMVNNIQELTKNQENSPWLEHLISWCSFTWLINNFLTFIIIVQNPKVPPSLSTKHYIHVGMNYESLLQVHVTVIDYLPSFLVTETQIVWSSKCQSRRPGVTLTARMWRNWKKKNVCTNIRNSPSAWNLNALKVNALPKKKELKSLRAYIYMFTSRLYMSVNTGTMK